MRREIDHSLQNKFQNSSRYEDMLELPHHISRERPQMAMEERAAQFSPFAALTGYGDAIRETGRLTERQLELEPDVKDRLNEKLRLLMELPSPRPEVSIVYFLPDEKKEGGSYVSVRGRVKKVDENSRQIVMENGGRIPLKAVMELDGDIFSSEE